LLGLALAAAGAPQAPLPRLPLPPLATVLREDLNSRTWRQEGELSGTLENASREFRQALAGGGWRLEKRIVAGRSHLLLCSRKRTRFLVMVWEKGVGACGFAWGEDAQQGP
jgi:hypothetical protein